LQILVGVSMKAKRETTRSIVYVHRALSNEMELTFCDVTVTLVIAV